MENNNTKHLIIVLDSSGSMECQREDIIIGVNNIIEQQQKLNIKNQVLSLIMFNSKVELVINKKDVQKCAYLTAEDYNPDDLTALYDALGYTFNKYKTDKDVFVMIITDGVENDSTMYNYYEIKTSIDELTELGWSFYYLCEDVKEVEEQGEQIGMGQSLHTYSQCTPSISLSLKDPNNDMHETIKDWSQKHNKNKNKKPIKKRLRDDNE